MVSFYDPVDAKDLSRVVRILRKDGIEFFTREEMVRGISPLQILVAEEDLARAEESLLTH
ncbi:MAG TPA: DUF2007 domain-containing protein [Desulfuromonadaceae bacterium]